MIIPVILSGGSGTRLWPLSTPEKPKQFLPLVSRHTLFQETLKRLEGLPALSAPIVVCNELHRFLVAEQLREIGTKAAAIVLEPEGRNTAPAIGVAAALVMASEGMAANSKPASGAILLVLPADHVIADAAAFRVAVENAVKAAEAGRLVTFGIVPTHPETGYGYIERGAEEGAWWGVERFIEKPDRGTAEGYLANGRFLWNSGMFVFSVAALEAELERHAPAIHRACKEAAAAAKIDADFTRLGPEFHASPSDSIDYAVMEQTDRAAVVPLDAGWSDVGSWDALCEVLERDTDDNALRGDVVSLGASNCLVLPGMRKVALLGVDNVVVVDADDALLVMQRGQSQRVKELIRLFRSERSD
jgi:mannose-1-phosphate guanylyltransferase/mannose-6-phosphate isomerase